MPFIVSVEPEEAIVLLDLLKSGKLVGGRSDIDLAERAALEILEGSLEIQTEAFTRRAPEGALEESKELLAKRPPRQGLGE